ncbi:MAG: hypothetical protein HDR71_15600 [Lachnospiraceae bacterium]|nr:hypothetical protein [Lachnospiraceae bacterium]
MKNERENHSCFNYDELIIEMIKEINDDNFKRRIYISIREYLRERRKPG